MLDINWHSLADTLGFVPHVFFDYDQAAALATHPVTPEVRESVCEARELGHMASFGFASDNPFVGVLSGMRSHADHIRTPFMDWKRLRIVTKANPQFFGAMLLDLGIDGSRTVMVGHDPIRDIENPQSVGITTIEVPELGSLADGILAHRGRRLIEPLAARLSNAA